MANKTPEFVRCLACGGQMEVGKLHACPEPPPKAKVRMVVCHGENLSPESARALLECALKALESDE